MPGFLGGSTSGGGTGGEVTLPKEFIDPVTKIRVSQPETLIDTDFEYGLQPTKWETVELINNTPSFFSKSGDTTIPNIVSVTTNAGTREITVTTALDHGLAVGIPINVTGTKSVTADGAYIINSIPNPTTFTYLCRDNQAETLSIEDLYTSIITGEFYQGSQLRIADSDGIVTDGDPVSVLTVKTESAHGFGVNTPFYFLNLNSTVAQEFEAANTAAKSFDSSNSATAQTFDGSNTLSQIQIDWSNSATVGGTPSSIVSVDAAADTITVTHTTETFVGSPIGTPLYYSVNTSSGYFSNKPRGVVFLKTTNQLASGTSIFQVSQIPNGDPIDIEAAMTGTFQLANQARTFAGNNVDPNTEIDITVIDGTPKSFEAANDGGVITVGEESVFSGGNPLCTVTSYSGSLVNVSTAAGAGLGLYQGAMVFYETTGSAASGLTDNTTYFVDSFFSTGTDTYAFTLKEYPDDVAVITVSGGTGTQTFKRIGLSLDKNVLHAKDSLFNQRDMVLYQFPENGRFGADVEKAYYFIERAFDSHNYLLSGEIYSPPSATGGTLTQIVQDGRTYNVHTFTSTGAQNFQVTSAGSDTDFEYLVVAGGGGGGASMTVCTNNAWNGGGGGAGGVLQGSFTPTAQTYTVTVGTGGAGAVNNVNHFGTKGGNSSIVGTATNVVAIGGGGGETFGATAVCSQSMRSADGGSGGGQSGYSGSGGGGNSGSGLGTAGQGTNGGLGRNTGSRETSGGGGGALTAGDNGAQYRGGKGGDGIGSWITGSLQYYGGGGGGGGRPNIGVAQGMGGIGGGGNGNITTRASSNIMPGFDATPNTGGGGGGAGDNIGGDADRQRAGNGGSGIVVIRYPITPAVESSFIVAEGGDLTTIIEIDGILYRVHAFTDTGSGQLNVVSVAAGATADILLVAGGGAGGVGYGDQDTGKGGGGAGGVLLQTGVALTAQTYNVSVGRGGRGWRRRFNTAPDVSENGQNTTGFGFTAIGGGGGGASDNYYAPKTGGSGGGAGARNSNSSFNLGANGTSGQGNRGGNSGGNGNFGGGGGGGAGGVGANGQSTTNNSLGGNGGIGRDVSSTFTTAFGQNGYFGGGGGGASYSTSTLLAQSQGGLGGGGRGTSARESSPNPGTQFSAVDVNALPNTGGGGGGAGEDGQGSGFREPGGSTSGDGGSGIILVRYRIS